MEHTCEPTPRGYWLKERGKARVWVSRCSCGAKTEVAIAHAPQEIRPITPRTGAWDDKPRLCQMIDEGKANRKWRGEKMV